MGDFNGNTVRKPRTSNRPRPYVFEVNKKTGGLVLRREKSPLLGEFPFVTAFALAVIFAVSSYCSFISLHAQAQCRVQTISELESEYYALSEQNNQTEKELFDVIDLESIYQIASTELGMVPTSRENVLLYDRSNSEYIFQTENIPLAETDSLWMN